MKGFKLDDNGDIVISNNKIQMVDGNELLKQTVQSVIGTNKGEWVLNRQEGIMFSNIFGKGNTEDMIRYEIQQGLEQVDETFIITSFEMTKTEDRKYKITFTAQNSIGEEVSGTNYYD